MKKTHQNILRYSLFFAVLLERIQDFRLRYYYASGTLIKKSKMKFSKWKWEEEETHSILY